MARSNLGIGDRPESSSRVCTSEDKVCRKLPEVSGPGLGEAGRYNGDGQSGAGGKKKKNLTHGPHILVVGIEYEI